MQTFVTMTGQVLKSLSYLMRSSPSSLDTGEAVFPLFSYTVIQQNASTTMDIETGDPQSPQAPKNHVDLVIATYTNIRTLHPILQSLFRDDNLKNAFLEAVDREKALIMERSQDLEDHEISKYQKAFVTMIEDEEYENNAGALELFLYEVMGFKKSETRLQMEKEILSYLGVMRALDQGERRGDQ